MMRRTQHPYSQLHQPPDTPAVFVVHGIGKQEWGQTAAQLYGNFEEAIGSIREWQQRNGVKNPSMPDSLPFPYEGFWADYSDPAKLFGSAFRGFSLWEQTFCRALWKQRVVSAGATYRWFVRQLFGLLGLPSLVRAMGPRAILSWPLYLLLIPFGFLILTLLYFRRSPLLRDFLNDIRLYIDPRGSIENEIVRGMDQWVAEYFLRLLGLTSDFRPLPNKEWVTIQGKPRRFDRVIWVAHSLGSVISYNVLSDLFHESEKLYQGGDDEQKDGVRLFRKSLIRFVTIGSPLDKVAVLFGKHAMRPWPSRPRKELLPHGDEAKSWYLGEWEDWWINFYHVLDPISGSLSSRLICGSKPPANYHAWSCLIPGVAHGTYWSNNSVLRYILSRAYGRARLADRTLIPVPALILSFLAGASYLFWTMLMAAVLLGAGLWGYGVIEPIWVSAKDLLGF